MNPLIKPVLLTLALACACLFFRDQGIRAGRAEVQAAWNAERAQLAAAAASASESARATEARRTTATQEIASHARNQQALNRTAADRAAAAGDGLRIRTATLAAACGGAASDSAAAAGGPSASSPGDLLADMQRRIGEAAGSLAAAADASRAAGAACERWADEVTK